MTAFRDVSGGSLGIGILTFLLFLVFFEIGTCVISLRRKSKPQTVFSVLRLVICAALFSLLLDSVYDLSYLPYTRAYPAAVGFASGLPVFFILVYAAVDTAAAVVCLVQILRREKTVPSAYAVKKTLDYLPIGVCIAEKNGAPPPKEIVETGGLLSLRRAVERSGGRMTVKPSPAFELTIEL